MGFQQGLSGLNVSSKNLDVIGNNVANATTVGFKSGQAQFADVFAASLQGAGASPVGLGAKVATVVQQFTQGNVTSSNNPLDVAINGGGFYRLSNAAGTVSFSRNGQFQFDKNDNIVNAEGLRLNGYGSVAGVIQTGQVAPIQLDRSDVTPQATRDTASGGTGVEVKVNLDSRKSVPTVAVFDPANPDSFNDSTAIAVYDSLGNAHTYSIYFVKDAAPNTWNIHTLVTDVAGVTADVTAGASASQIVFDSSGTLTTAMPLTQAIADTAYNAVAGTVLPGSFDLNFGGTTQFGGSFTVNTLRQDGYTLGKLSGFSISPDGVMVGRYTNGQSRDMAQVVLSGFANPQGLSAIGGNQWVETSTSGPELVGTPGSDGAHGVLQSSAVEDSNVDLTAELVNMITAQRIYQANAQTIKTQDQVLQTLVNIR